MFDICKKLLKCAIMENENKLFMEWDTNEGVKFFSKTSIALIEEVNSSVYGYRLRVVMKEKRENGSSITFFINPEALTDVWDELKDFSVPKK
jgi:hypothetical protein